LRLRLLHQSRSRRIVAQKKKKKNAVEDIANKLFSKTMRLDTLHDGRGRGARSRVARALFVGEYGDEVQFVIMGEGRSNASAWFGRTLRRLHACRSHGDIGLISRHVESAVASGVRRNRGRLTRKATRGIIAKRHSSRSRKRRSPNCAPRWTNMPCAHRFADGRSQEAGARPVGGAPELAMAGGACGGPRNRGGRQWRSPRLGTSKLMARAVEGHTKRKT